MTLLNLAELLTVKHPHTTAEDLTFIFTINIVTTMLYEVMKAVAQYSFSHHSENKCGYR